MELNDIETMANIASMLIDCYAKSGMPEVKDVFVRSIDGLDKMIAVYNQSMGITTMTESLEESPETT